MISVIIPHYNRSETVGRAIYSVLSQTHRDLEIVVVDDASSDHEKLQQTILELADPRIHLVRHGKNSGGGAARNTGVARARGDYIAFLDSDDEWLPTKLEKQLELAKKQSDSDWLIYSQSKVLTPQAGMMPHREIGPSEPIGDYLFTNRGWLPTPAMLLPRSLASKVPFNPNLRRHQDYDFLLRLEAIGCRFLMVPEPLVIVHWEDLHQTARGLNPANSLKFLQEYQRFLSPHARSGFVFSQVVMRLLSAGRRLEGIWNFTWHVRPWHLKTPQHVSFISAIIFRDARIAKILANAKSSMKLYACEDKASR